MKTIAGLLSASLLAVSLIAGCQPRNLIPSASGAGTSAASVCDSLPNCGQCVSDARCGWCSESKRCLASDRAQACQSGWIPKDPEQQLCPAEPPSTQSQTAQQPGK
jgi:hypothetical protein